jgi:hypothetical protein
MSVEGTWDLTISSPIGRIKAIVELRREQGALGQGVLEQGVLEQGVLTGSAQGAGEQVPLHDLVLDGDHLTWRQEITKPIRLNLAFAVIVDGDHLTGTSKAGRLPASKVVGQRRPAADAR